MAGCSGKRVRNSTFPQALRRKTSCVASSVRDVSSLYSFSHSTACGAGNYISLMTNNVEKLLLWLPDILMSSLMKCSLFKTVKFF